MTKDHSFAIQCYIEDRVAPSEKVTFSWQSKKGVTRSVMWDPMILAHMSPFYRSTEGTECKTFEINQRNTITDDNTAWLFHNTMMPDIPGWDKEDPALPENLIDCEYNPDMVELDLIHDDETGDTECTLDNIYDALELCHFLGIEANGNLSLRLFGDIARAKRYDTLSSKHLIVYHQIFTRLHYKAGIDACEKMFEIKYSTGLAGVFWANLNTIVAQNEVYICKVRAYMTFAEENLDLATNEFLQTRLGWTKDKNEVYGVKISLAGLENGN